MLIAARFLKNVMVDLRHVFGTIKKGKRESS